MIAVVGLSHRTAPLEIRERVAIPHDSLPALIGELLEHQAIGEAVVLSTCNRVEAYVAARVRGAPTDAEIEAAGRAAHDILVKHGGEAVGAFLAVSGGTRAVSHLFRVASSLDSLVVGEPQILGQLKDAIEVARDARALGPALGKAMHRALHVGKRVRSETAIGAGQVSVSSVAVDLARQIFGDLTGRTALLIGAGEMAEAAAKHLVKAGAVLRVANRSPARAEALVRDLGGETRPFAELEKALVECDIVVASTSSPTPVLTKDLVKRAEKARRGKSLFLIDIAVPRDVHPAVNDLDNVFVYDVDDLSKIVAESLESRASEAARGEAIVREETAGFEAWARERSMAPVIAGLRGRTRGVLFAELERSLSGKLKHLPQADRDALAIMLEAATNKLLHVPVTKLKTLAADGQAPELVDALTELFELEDVPVPERGPSSRRTDHHGEPLPSHGAAPAEAASPPMTRGSLDR